MEKRIQIGRINKVEIFAVESENGEILVPIKPICEAIGVVFAGQYNKITEDDFLKSVVYLSYTTGADNKQYEMVCLHLKYIYGWLFTINPKNVAPAAKDAVMRYRTECYEALYAHFFKRSAVMIEANKAEIKELENINTLLTQEKEIKGQIRDARERLAKIRTARLDEQPTLF